MKGKVVSLAVVLLMVIGSYGAVGTKINAENDLDTIQAVPLSRSWPELAKAYVYSAGNKEDSCAEVTCHSLDDIKCKYGDAIRFQVHYTLDLSSEHMWDEAICEAKIRYGGYIEETEYKKISDGYLDALFLFDINHCKHYIVEWEVNCKLTDTWGELKDSCSGSLEIMPIGDLSCTGEVYDRDVRPGEKIDRSFEVKNCFCYDSELDWEIVDYPNWGSDWSIDPMSGENLGAGCSKNVRFSFTAPKPSSETLYSGEIKIVNLDDSSDTADVILRFTVKTSKDKGSVNPVVLKFLQAFPFLENLQQTYSFFSI